ncbi:uncharacterized protein LOC125537075 isoform X2 [Triticum urartu]|uniref:uncharacterized protein LOC125537075 isoform X2 n=1 Tax=Triticum urartu TaxID=4572 RepID=UPI0020433265|nr:uncharacterized protein LOC125537075 isoform X2 [Triticum urartu]
MTPTPSSAAAAAPLFCNHHAVRAALKHAAPFPSQAALDLAMEVAAVVAMEVSPAAFEVLHPRYRRDCSRLAKEGSPGGGTAGSGAILFGDAWIW